MINHGKCIYNHSYCIDKLSLDTTAKQVKDMIWFPWWLMQVTRSLGSEAYTDDRPPIRIQLASIVGDILQNIIKNPESDDRRLPLKRKRCGFGRAPRHCSQTIRRWLLDIPFHQQRRRPTLASDRHRCPQHIGTLLGYEVEHQQMPYPDSWEHQAFTIWTTTSWQKRKTKTTWEYASQMTCPDRLIYHLSFQRLTSS